MGEHNSELPSRPPLPLCPSVQNVGGEVIHLRDIVIVENIRLVRRLALTADFGVKTNAKLTQIFQLRERSKTGI